MPRQYIDPVEYENKIKELEGKILELETNMAQVTEQLKEAHAIAITAVENPS